MAYLVRLVVIGLCLLLGAAIASAHAVHAFAPAGALAGAWAPNTAYRVGDQVTYAGTTYECLQAHTAQTGWEPPAVPALWRVVAGSPATATPSRTASRTATRTATRTQSPSTITPSGPTATPAGGAACAAAWSAGAVYLGGAQVSRTGQTYQAAYWTQGQDPALYNGPAGSGQPWLVLGPCGSVTTTSVPATATRTPTLAAATATRTPTLAAATATVTTPAPTAPGGAWPSRIVAPYADISFTSVGAARQATGHGYYALGFVLAASGTCAPAWDGAHSMAENYYAAEIQALRAAGGDAGAVFGGASGSDLASVCPTVSSLQAAYQAVLDRYQFKWIDLNVEGGMLSDPGSIDRRNRALAALQAANPQLRVSYTLPVAQSGLLQDALDLLSNAKTHHVRVDYVNIMTMNYGPAGLDMGQAAIESATRTRQQLVSLGLTSQLGVTPMIGQNNTTGEIFDLGDADELLAFARANSYIGWVSFWSVGRDNGTCPGQPTASASCSGLAQSPYAFTNKFNAFP